MIDYDLKDKHVIVTGFNSGIGKAQTIAFLRQGAIVYGIDLETNNEASIIDEVYGHEAMNFNYFKGDVSNIDSVYQFKRFVLRHTSKIDVICNTAGILDGFRMLESTDLHRWNTVMNTNVTSMYNVVSEFLAMLRCEPLQERKTEHTRATIINMASIAGLVADGGGIAYTTSKHAIVGFTKQLASDYGKLIRTNAIAPGTINTPMNALDSEATLSILATKTPSKRNASPEEVANLTLFLASYQSDFINGQVIPIDGGWTIR